MSEGAAQPFNEDVSSCQNDDTKKETEKEQHVSSKTVARAGDYVKGIDIGEGRAYGNLRLWRSCKSKVLAMM